MPRKVNILKTNSHRDGFIGHVAKVGSVGHSSDGNLIYLVEDESQLNDSLRCNFLLISNKCSVSDSQLEKYDYAIIENLSDRIFVDDVVSLDVSRRRLYLLYEAKSKNNALYVTDLCNSHCIMCPQPPKEVDDVGIEKIKEIIKNLPQGVEFLGITGGEPTMLHEELCEILELLKEKNPDIFLHILSNARLFEDYHYTKRIRTAAPRNTTFGVPLYSAEREIHDFITQASGSYDETIRGIINLAKFGFGIEIRTVLHKQTVNGLPLLADFIYNKLPFVAHVAFMGMEHMGFVKRNWEWLWISPKDYQERLYEAVRFLFIRGINISIYNLPYCLTDKRLWGLLTDSITDFKKDFQDKCNECLLKQTCGGLFHYQKDNTEVVPIRLF